MQGDTKIHQLYGVSSSSSFDVVITALLLLLFLPLLILLLPLLVLNCCFFYSHSILLSLRFERQVTYKYHHLHPSTTTTTIINSSSFATETQDHNTKMPLFQIPTYEILWGKSRIDWCEKNDPTTNPFGIMEFHNTWSNLFYVAVGIVNAIVLTSGKSPKDPLLYFFCLFAIMTGVTSAWFHATLLYIGQKSDEFFENAMILALAYSHLFPIVGGTGKRQYTYFGIHVILLGIGVFCIPDVFCEVHLLFAVLASSYFSRKRSETIKNSVERQKSIDNNHWALMWGALGFAMWIVDMVACSPIIQQLHLHAYAWHLLTAVALHVGCSGTIRMNQILQQQLHTKQP